MHMLCQEVQKFVSACEGLQSVLALGGVLSPDERGVIEDSMIQLLENMKLDTMMTKVPVDPSFEPER